MWLWSKNKALPKTVLQVEVFNTIVICWEIQKIAVYWEWNSNNLSKIIEKHFATGKKNTIVEQQKVPPDNNHH